MNTRHPTVTTMAEDDADDLQYSEEVWRQFQNWSEKCAKFPHLRTEIENEIAKESVEKVLFSFLIDHRIPVVSGLRPILENLGEIFIEVELRTIVPHASHVDRLALDLQNLEMNCKNLEKLVVEHEGCTLEFGYWYLVRLLPKLHYLRLRLQGERTHSLDALLLLSENEERIPFTANNFEGSNIQTLNINESTVRVHNNFYMQRFPNLKKLCCIVEFSDENEVTMIDFWMYHNNRKLIDLTISIWNSGIVNLKALGVLTNLVSLHMHIADPHGTDTDMEIINEYSLSSMTLLNEIYIKSSHSMVFESLLPQICVDSLTRAAFQFGLLFIAWPEEIPRIYETIKRFTNLRHLIFKIQLPVFLYMPRAELLSLIDHLTEVDGLWFDGKILPGEKFFVDLEKQCARTQRIIEIRVNKSLVDVAQYVADFGPQGWLLFSGFERIYDFFDRYDLKQ